MSWFVLCSFGLQCANHTLVCPVLWIQECLGLPGGVRYAWDAGVSWLVLCLIGHWKVLYLRCTSVLGGVGQMVDMTKIG